MGNACLLAAALLPNEMLHPKLPLLSLSTEIQLVNLQQRFNIKCNDPNKPDYPSVNFASYERKYAKIYITVLLRLNIKVVQYHLFNPSLFSEKR